MWRKSPFPARFFRYWPCLQHPWVNESCTVPVMINGQGPFDFVVDTGADRTVISEELAKQLN